jgi:hypothetical protein
MRASSARATTAGVSSVEPSSTITSSQSANVCARTLSIACASHEAWL